MSLDQTTRERLERYLADVRALPNESAKTHRFIALVAELFPGSNVITEVAGGIEKRVRISDTQHGRIDAYYGNVVIEFERDLKATGETALSQLRDYCTGVWREGGDPTRPLLAVASDGITWRVFRPTPLADSTLQVQREGVHLQPLRELTLSKDTLSDFWIWITGLLFRPATKLPTPEQFRIEFGASSLAFADAMGALRTVWKEAKREPEAGVAFDTWCRYLTYTYGSIDQDPEHLDELFLKHTYLVSVARLLVWASLSHGELDSKTHSQVASEVLSGGYFETTWGIRNLVEDDFFQWVRRPPADNRLAPVWERTISQLQTYSLHELGHDVLKGVYQELVDPQDRHDLGEYYTPEWLCERLVAELLPETGWVSAIDPTCGSGSFIRAVISHLLQANASESDQAKLDAVLSGVVGIDIHPVAVTIARATYVLALGPVARARLRPIEVPVFLADALFLPSEVAQLTLGGKRDYRISFGGQHARVDERLVKTPKLFDPTLAHCTEIAIAHAKSGQESPDSLGAFLRREVPDLASRTDFATVVEGLWGFVQGLATLIRERQDSIWAFIVRNSYRPTMLKGQFDVIIGNPPWLSYRYIADPEYQAEVKQRAVGDYGIAPAKMTLTTQMELATVFLVHAISTFGREGSRLGFVLPRSVLTSDQHAKLRLRTYVAPFELNTYWDMQHVSPLFKVPSCVLLGSRRQPFRATSYVVDAVEWAGRLPNRDVPWSEAADRLTVTRKKGRLIYLGKRCALSTEVGSVKPTSGSMYLSHFRQGATLVPRNCYFVHLPQIELSDVSADGAYRAVTEPEQAKLAKRPYKDVHLDGLVEGRFLFHSALSTNLLPFIMRGVKLVVLPVLPGPGGKMSVRTGSELRIDGYRRMAKWMSEVEAVWTEKRGKKASKQTVYERLDYNRELTHQSLSNRFLVLYNASGTNLAAAVVDTTKIERPFIVDAKLYWAACDKLQEAEYLAAVLNSREANARIKPFQSTGLQGERDIHKKVLELAIPLYDASIQLHRDLAGLGGQAREEAKALLNRGELSGQLGRARQAVRQAVGDTLDRIDLKVAEILL